MQSPSVAFSVESIGHLQGRDRGWLLPGDWREVRQGVESCKKVGRAEMPGVEPCLGRAAMS